MLRKTYFFLSIIFLMLPSICFASYTAEYPSSYSDDTYIKASNLGSAYRQWFAIDPSLSLIDGLDYNAWYQSGTTGRFHIEFPTQIIARRIYYEPMHSSGAITTYSPKNFTLWGSDSSTAFNDLTYSNDTGWNLIGTYQFEEHVSANTTDPKYINLDNSLSYKYFAFKISDTWGGSNMGLRRLTLQTEDGYTGPTPTLTPTPTPIPQQNYDATIATNSAQFGNSTSIFYSLYTQQQGGCTISQYCWNELFMTIHNNTSDWNVTNVSIDNENYNISVPAYFIDSFDTGLFHYTSNTQPPTLNDWFTPPVIITLCSVTNESNCGNVSLNQQGSYANVESTLSGITTGIPIIPTTCGSINLGTIHIPDFFCEFKQWLWSVLTYIFGIDSSSLTGKFNDLTDRAYAKVPWAYLYALESMDFSDPILATPDGIPEFHIASLAATVIDKENNSSHQVQLFADTTLTKGTFGPLDYAVTAIRLGLNVLLIGLFSWTMVMYIKSIFSE
jgi:hypothetical protein